MRWLALVLVLLATPVYAAPPACRSVQNQLTTCQLELSAHKPLVQPVLYASTTVGVTVVVQITLPPDPGGAWVVWDGAPDGYMYVNGLWDVARVAPDAWNVAFTPEAAGHGVISYRIVVNGQLYEFPIVVDVAP